jgi:hypothetical protein
MFKGSSVGKMNNFLNKRLCFEPTSLSSTGFVLKGKTVSSAFSGDGSLKLVMHGHFPPPYVHSHRHIPNFFNHLSAHR